eukprot:scaffold25842_cov198-Amphora_coffeaeformis.AAC.40
MASYDELKEQYSALESQIKSGSAELANQDGEKNADAQNEIAALREQVEQERADAEAIIAQWKDSYDGLREQYDALQSLREAVMSSDEKCDISEVKNEVETLKQQLESERAEADAVVVQWQNSYNDLEKRFGTLQGQQGTGEESDNAELRSEIETIKKQLENERADADAAVAQWEASFLDLQKQYDTLQNEQAEKDPSEAALDVDEMKNEIKELKRQLQEESTQAEGAISQWQASYNDLQEQYDALKNEHDTLVYGGKDEARAGLASEVENLKKQLAEVSAEAENAIEQWQSSYKDLEERYEALKEQTNAPLGSNGNGDLLAQIDALQKQLQEESDEADNIIAQWKASHDALQEENEVLRVQLSPMTDTGPSDNSGELKNEIENLRKELQEQRDEADSLIAQWKASYDALREEHEALKAGSCDTTCSIPEQNTEDLRAKIGELRNELQEEKDQADIIASQWEASYNDLKKQLEAAQTGSEDVAGLKAEIEALNIRLHEEAAEAEGVIAQWEESYLALETENGKLRQELQSAASESTGGDIPALQKEIYGLRNEVEDSCREKEVWENKYLILESEMEIQKVEYETLAKQFAEAQAVTSNGEKDFNSVIAELESEISTLKEQIDSDNREANATVSHWEESYEILHTENQELLAAKSALEEKAEALLLERDDLTERMSQIKSESASNIDEISRLSDKARKLQETVDVMTKDSAEMAAKIETLESEYSTILSVRDGLEAKVNELTESLSGNDVTGLQSKIDDLETQLAEEAKEADDAISQWQESYNELEETRLSLEAQLESVRDGEAARTGEVERLKEEMHHSSEELKAGKAEIQSLKESYAKLQSMYDEAISEIDSLRANENTSDFAQLQAEVESLRQQIHEKSDESTEVVNQWSESYHGLQEDYNGILDELNAARNETDELRVEMERLQNPLSDETEDLRAQLAQLQQQRDIEARDADDAIEQWQTSYDDLQQDFETLQKEMDEVINRSNKLDDENKNLLKQLDSSGDEAAEELNKLRRELSLVKTQRDDDAQKAEEAIKQWQESYEGLEADLANARAEIESASTIKEEWETHMAALQDRLSELEAAMEQTVRSNERLQAQLDEMTSRASHVEAVLEQRKVEFEDALADKQAIIDRLEGDLIHDTRSRDNTGKRESDETEAQPETEKDCKIDLQHDHEFLTNEMAALREMVECLQTELGEEKRLREQRDHELDDSEEIVNSWKTRVDELETLEHELRNELDRTQQDAEEAISIWEEQCHDLEEQLSRKSDVEVELAKAREEVSRISELLSLPPEGSSSMEAERLQRELEEEREVRNSADERVFALEEKLKATEETFTARIESIQADHARAKTSEDAHRLHELERMNELEQKNEDFRRQKATAEADVDRLRVQLSEQDNEIRELYSSLKLHQTNEISSRGAKLAAQELRKQVDMLQKELEQDTKAVEAERTSRLAAEQETKRIRADLAALLGVENTEENQSEIRRRTIEATEHFQRKEQAEIEELRGSLNKVLNELDKARREATQAEDRSLRAELDFSAVEEELMAVRSELKYMTVAKDELQDAESSRQASLEARIAALESDHISLRRFHASEMERLRSELNQVTSERDRLSQSVRNAESCKESILGSLTLETPDGDLGAELRRLRLENAALLSQFAEEAARTERRIREARSADRSASQTQVVVERELRLAAERALAVANEDMAKAKQAGSVQDPSAKTRIDELTQHLEASHTKSEKLSNQLAELRRELEELRRKSRHEKEQLQEECRQAKHRVTQLEQKGRFEAEVRAEVARIQSSPSRGKAEDDGKTRALAEVQSSSQTPSDQATVARLYDIIESLREQMEEERKVHLVDREEMEDLLKLVVQQKLGMDSLTSALQAVAGDVAVEQALDDAQARAEAQYGRSMQ